MQVTLPDGVLDVQVTGDGPPVVLLHGFPQTGHSWRHVLPHLDGFRCVVPDQRGYSPGLRPLEVEAYRAPSLLADVLALADALELGPFHLVGHDFGAAVAWQVAARQPSRLLSLTVLSVPHPRAMLAALAADPDQRTKSLYMRDFASPGYDQVLLADDAAGLRALFGGVPAVDVDETVRRASEPGALAAWLRWYAAQRRADLDDVGPVAVPTLHVWSRGDVALGEAATRGTSDWVTAPYRLEVLEGSHWIPEEAADVVGPLVAAHLCST